MAASPGTIAIARPRGTYLALAAAGFGFAGAVVALAVTRASLDLLSGVELVCAAVLMLGSFSALYSAVSRGPALTVSDEGIVDCTSLFGVGLVRWDEITGLATFRYLTQRYLLIFLLDPTAFATRLGPLPRAVVKINEVLSPAPICIPSALLPGMDELLAKIQERYDHQLTAHGIQVQRQA